MPLTTVRQAVESGLPKISDLSNVDPIVTRATITLEVENLLQFLNIGKSMNAQQIAQTIEMIIVCYPDLNLADIKLFFFWLKKGEYGKIYDRMDGSTILEAMESYHQSRIEDAENAHNELKHSNKTQYHPDVVKFMSSAVNEYRDKIRQKRIEEFKKPRNLTEAEIFYQRCLLQFDNLHAGNEKMNRNYAEKSGVRMLVIGGVRMTINEFLERKINNRINLEN